MNRNKGTKKRMSEDDKKKKFGDKYDPDFSKNEARDTKKKTSPWDYKSRTNDYRWYSIDENIAKNFGNLPFNLLAGLPFSLRVNSGASPTFNPQSIMAINVVNAIAGAGNTAAIQISGGGMPVSAGLRVASNQLYQYIRHVNSGARNYEPADIIMFVLAVRDVYAEVCEIRRAMGLTNFYVMQNVSMPQRLVDALQIDYEDLVKNLANYRGYLNTLIKRVNAFAMPNYFRAFYRTDFVFSNIFMDSTSVRGQYYLLRRTGYYTLSSTASTTGTSLVYQDYYPISEEAQSKSGASVDQYHCSMAARLSALNAMIEALETDTDALTMAGDILAAFKEAQLLQLSTVGEEYIVVPIMDENMLAQIENCVLSSTFASNVRQALALKPEVMAQMNVTQKNGQIQNFILSDTSKTYLAPQSAGMLEFIFNSHLDNPDYTHILDWTRLMSFALGTTSSAANTLTYGTSGLEIPISAVMYDVENNSVELLQNRSIVPSTTEIGDVDVFMVSQYDWHPTIYRWVVDASGARTGIHPIADLKKFTVINSSQISNLNAVANMAAFYADGLFDKTNRG